MMEVQDNKRKKVLITGAEGIIGQLLSSSLSHTFEIIGVDRRSGDNAGLIVDLTDAESLDKALSTKLPIDCIIHLAANAKHVAPWTDILNDNIITTKNIYEFARKQAIKKVIFTSSTHLYGGYEGYPDTPAPFTRPIAENDPPRPDGDYGTSKGFGELIASQYHALFGIESICLRIGGVSWDNKPMEMYERLWLSHQDTIQIFEKAVLTTIPFGIYFAISNNTPAVYDISSARRDLGFEPVDGYTDSTNPL